MQGDIFLFPSTQKERVERDEWDNSLLDSDTILVFLCIANYHLYPTRMRGNNMKGLRERGRKFGRKASLHFITYNCWLKLSPSEDRKCWEGPGRPYRPLQESQSRNQSGFESSAFFWKDFPITRKKNLGSFYASFFAAWLILCMFMAGKGAYEKCVVRMSVGWWCVLHFTFAWQLVWWWIFFASTQLGQYRLRWLFSAFSCYVIIKWRSVCVLALEFWRVCARSSIMNRFRMTYRAG